MQCVFAIIALQTTHKERSCKDNLPSGLLTNLNSGLESIAHRLNRKRSDIVRLALQKFIGEAEAEAGLSPFDKIQHLAGSAETGVTDLGENHREHLNTRFKRHA